MKPFPRTNKTDPYSWQLHRKRKCNFSFKTKRKSFIKKKVETGQNWKMMQFQILGCKIYYSEIRGQRGVFPQNGLSFGVRRKFIHMVDVENLFI